MISIQICYLHNIKILHIFTFYANIKVTFKNVKQNLTKKCMKKHTSN